MRTGIALKVTTLVAWLPSSTLEMPRRPWEAMTIRSQPLSLAAPLVFVFAVHGRAGDADLVGRLRDAPEDPVGRRGDSLLLVGHRIGQGALDERCH